MIKPQGQNRSNQILLKPFQCNWLKLFLCGCVLAATTVTAAPILNTANPVCFFTNVASRLLSEEMNVNFARIEIYPTNQFTPAVHRLLQIAANIYDASTNRYYDPVPSTNTIPLPTVFQPVFSVEGGSVYITNFVEVMDTSIFTNTIRNLNYGSTVVAALQPNDLVFGVPLIIGAKKGLPNFNEFAMQSGFQLMRKLQVTRSSTNAPASTYQINQMFGLGVTNQFGVECWNSYSSNYTRPMNIYVTNYLTVTLTNDEGFSTMADMILSGSIQIPVWSAWNFGSPSASFQIPLNTNVAAVPFSIYRFNGGNPFLTANPALPFETGVIINGSQYPQPNWGLTVANNLQVIMVDVISGRIIDYVQLSGPNSSRNLSMEIQNEYDTGNLQGYNGLWITNLISSGVPSGIANQIGTSVGEFGFSGVFPEITPNENEIDGFRAFYHISPEFNNPGEAQIIAAAQTNLAIQVPYTPIANTYEHVTWQVNDPLVHYLASDLMTPTSDEIDNNFIWPGNVGQLNARYTPWGGNPMLPGADLNPYNLALKDPLVLSSDGWDFPNGQPLNPDLIGQVHRGTPWQTIYLKSSNILAAPNGFSTWASWTGDLDTNDAAAMAPVQDWHLASLLTSLLNTNNLASLFSVNNPNPNAWQGLLNGLIASTNIPDQFDSVLISSNSSQAAVIADAIQSERAGQPGQFFSDVGDILATPQLAEQSPFLAGVNTNIISDENYEIIPSQLLSLLRADSVGAVALMNGQPLVQFTGYDGHAYAIQVSSNLVNWVSISTNCPVNGVFSFTNSTMLNANQQFYRSVLLH